MFRDKIKERSIKSSQSSRLLGIGLKKKMHGKKKEDMYLLRKGKSSIKSSKTTKRKSKMNVSLLINQDNFFRV